MKFIEFVEFIGFIELAGFSAMRYALCTMPFNRAFQLPGLPASGFDGSLSSVI
jgi:hypothetical protein